MLRLEKITKDYDVADFKVNALRGVSLSFRQNEFVAVLGPSGCGKTTLLNIVGGLDKYTTGDLKIKGRSTKDFKDKDWDTYRNHRIGFVFQSYNLIPHQTVLGNVELSLTISGISKKERRERAIAVLDKVGLKGEYRKRPNQLSGGQSQRVAIARALINDPEILLADEPTGALDTETSVQIMDLIAEIAKDRLVIMVTHNPDLAKKYANRIIRLLDGEVLSDSNPHEGSQDYDDKDEGSKEKAKMSFRTAFSLSLQNLFTKKARTILTSVAGSIGIIGVSLVLALSQGLHSQIANIQNDMLAAYPITISKQAFDLSAMEATMSEGEKNDIIREAGYVNVEEMVAALLARAETTSSILVTNEITDDYLTFLRDIPEEALSAAVYDYGLDLSNNLFTELQITKEEPGTVTSLAAIRQMYAAILEDSDYADLVPLIGSLDDTFFQVPNNEEYVLGQYEFVDGIYPRAANEIMIVLNDNAMINDLLLAQLGYFAQEEFLDIVENAANKTSVEPVRISYTELLDKTFTWYPNDTVFNIPEPHPMFPDVTLDPVTYNAYYDNTFTEGVPLTITGILRPKDGLQVGSLATGFYYTEDLTDHIFEANYESEINEFARLDGRDSFMGMEYKITIGPNDYYKNLGITYDLTFEYDGALWHEDNPALRSTYLGKVDAMSSLFGSIIGGGMSSDIVSVSVNELAGNNIPNEIRLYSKDFAEKKLLINYLDRWNSSEALSINGAELSAEEREKIIYTDTLSFVVALISTLLNAITIALIGFTALALIVSSVMIAIITYVSVVERTKEIGVIRSLGGRKKDVSRLFNAETFIIGFASGIFGIFVTYLGAGLINLIVNPLIGMNLAIFPPYIALIMLMISVLLTVISGFVPSKSAAKKDPVVALRTE